jgi:hypothetical protein
MFISQYQGKFIIFHSPELCEAIIVNGDDFSQSNHEKPGFGRTVSDLRNCGHNLVKLVKFAKLKGLGVELQ